MGDGNQSITISDSNFPGINNVSNGPITVVRDSPKATVGDLRGELRRHRAEIVELAGTQGPRAERALDHLEQELADPEPDKDVVRGGWKSVTKLLAGGAAAAESVTKIAELVRTLTGA